MAAFEGELGTPIPLGGRFFPVLAGALVAVGISLTLTTFGAAIGLSVISGSPTWRESSALLWCGSGLFLVFVSLWAFGLGGYVVGRLQQPLSRDSKDLSFRDGIYGVVSWGTALALSAALAGVLALATKPAATSTDSSASSSAEVLISTELDLLFRDARRDRGTNFAYHRAEAGRILLQASGRRGVPSDDRDYLAALVTAHTGLETAQAMDRVNRAVANARLAIRNARVAAVLQAFMIAAALALGAAISWFSAVEGGKARDQAKIPEWSWVRRRAA